MKGSRKLLGGVCAAAFVLSPLVLIAYPEGPDPAVSGAPGDEPQGCAKSQCHTGPSNPTSGSGVELVFSDGATYTPGVTQRLTVRITSPQSAINGFQLSVRPSSDPNQQAGDLNPIDGRTLVLCRTGTTKPCNPAAPVQYIEHSSAGSSGGSEWAFDWTPPATDVGPVTFYFAGNAANGNGQENGDRIYLNFATATPKALGQAPQIREAFPVLQAFLGGERISPGTWIEIYGTNLAPSVQDWTGLFTNGGTTAPTSINNVSVTVDGKPAFLFYTSPGQINALVPDGIGQGLITVEVTTPGGKSARQVQAAAVSPALLTTPSFLVNNVQHVAALFQDNVTFVGPVGLISGVNFRPARPGEVITIYAVGCGSVAGAPAGTVVSGLNLVPNAQVRFGEVAATTAAAMSPGAIGLCQFNVTIPNVAAGTHTLSATVNGIGTNQNLRITTGQ
jgi:uncharacterized protein (TIGR03437 family)